MAGTLGAAAIGAASSRSANKAAARASQASADATGLQAQIAAEQWDKYNEIYDPLERQIVKESQQYDTPEQYAREAGDASATVASQFGKARERLARTPGLDPSSGAFQAGMTGLELSQAATDVTQQNAARNKVRDTAYARRLDALSLGKGLPANASTGLASAAATNRAIANDQMRLGMDQAASAGRVAERIFTPKNINAAGNWLGFGNSQAPVVQDYGAMDMGGFSNYDAMGL
jgi:hypothetical protein